MARRAGCTVRKEGLYGQTLPIPHELGVRLSCRVDTEVREEGPVRRDGEGDGADAEGAGGAHG